MFVFLLLLSFIQTQTLKRTDLTSESQFLVFLYYEKKNFTCPVCEEFMGVVESLDIPVKTLNFAENVELGSRFLQHTFPAFVVRSGGRSYVIDPKDIEDLREIIKNESWKETKPVRSHMDVNSMFAAVFSKINVVIFFGINFFYFLMNYVPDYIVSVFIVVVITFLGYSIYDVLRMTKPKQKIH